MPELPEVETVVRTLKPLVCNKKITNVEVFLDKVIKEPELESFKEAIIGQTISDIKRKAKLIIFVLDDYVLLSHLRMEGKYYFQELEDFVPAKHVLLTLELDKHYYLRYHDTRRFGTFHLQPKSDFRTLKPFIKLGPEPFNQDVSVNYLQSKWKKRNQKVKTALLDQTVISGLGNIYADEVLFYANVHPETNVRTLTTMQITKIIEGAIKVLELAIKLGGTTISTYTSSLGVTGKFQNELKVHMRKGMQCYVCQEKINKIKVNGRGTYFCANCQTKN